MSAAELGPAERLPDGPWVQTGKIAFRFIFLGVGVLALFWLVSNLQRIAPDSRAVVLRFGVVSRVAGPGLLLAWPSPVEQVVLVPARDRQIEFRLAHFSGPASAGPAGAAAPAGRDMLLTGDTGVVRLQATLFYHVTDPADFVLARDHVAPALERLFDSAAVAVCGSRPLDAILVAGPGAATAAAAAEREQLRADLVRAVNRRLAGLREQSADLGVEVTRVDLNVTLPPKALDAFNKVLAAQQNAEQAIAEARTSAELNSQQAQQGHDRIIAQAQAAASESVGDTRSWTAPIRSLAGQAEDRNGTGMSLLNRLYYTRMADILSKAGRVDSVDTRGGMHLLLQGATQ